MAYNFKTGDITLADENKTTGNVFTNIKPIEAFLLSEGKMGKEIPNEVGSDVTAEPSLVWAESNASVSTSASTSASASSTASAEPSTPTNNKDAIAIWIMVNLIWLLAVVVFIIVVIMCSKLFWFSLCGLGLVVRYFATKATRRAGYKAVDTVESMERGIEGGEVTGRVWK